MKNTKGYEIYETIEKSLNHEIKERRTELNHRLSMIDKEICDIRHYIEFYTFNASKGYKLCKMLKDKLIERREILEEFQIVNSVSTMTVESICNGKGRKTIEKLQNKQYTPRVLNELFEDKED